jgi:hypothetical protein
MLCFTPSIKLAYGVDIGGGTGTPPTVTISADTTDPQTFDQPGVTLTIDNGATITKSGNQAVQAGTNSTIIVNSGGTINATGNQAIAAMGDNTTIIINSGTIDADGNLGIKISNTTNAIITNNVGGLITAATNTILAAGSSGLTITNSGTISVESLSSDAIDLGSGTGATITLKNGSLIIGKISTTGTGNKLQFDHGFGRAYFYETTGDFILEDLSGNTVVKGSAGSVGQGANETVDELLGLRSYNLRSTLKRYSAFPKKSGKKEIYTEPFSYYSKRGISSSVLGYDTYGYGLNIIYPLLPNKLDLVATFEKNELELEGDHDISNTNVLVGINVPDFINLGPLKVSGFFVAGTGHHEGKRKILTNTTTTGVLDVTSDYTSYEAITGTHASYSYKASPESKNIWTTEVGLTIGHSTVKAYSESEYFSWKKRNLTQGSIHLGEKLTSKITDKLAVTVEGEVEGRTVFTGRKQAYAINGTPVESRDKQFRQATVSAKLGANYTMNNSSIAYVNLDSRFSNYAKSKGTYGANVGLSLPF